MALEPTPAPAGETALFVGRVTSRRPSSYVTAAVLWALLIAPGAVLLAPSGPTAGAALVLLLFSLPMAAAAGYSTYCIVTNRAWQLTVTKDHVAWDGTSNQAHVVTTQDIVRLSVARSDTDGAPFTTITLHLRDGSEREIPTMFSAPPDDAALLRAIQRAVPKVFTRHLS